MILSRYTVDIRYLEYPLSRTFSISNFYLVPSAFSLTSLVNPLGISNSAISNFHYVKPFFRSRQSFLGCFLSAIWNIWMGFRENHTVHFRHSNINNCIEKTLFGSLFFLSFNTVQQMSSVKRKFNVKSLGEKYKILRDLEKGLSKKDVAEKYGVPRNTISTWVKNKSKY